MTIPERMYVCPEVLGVVGVLPPPPPPPPQDTMESESRRDVRATRTTVATTEVDCFKIALPVLTCLRVNSQTDQIGERQRHSIFIELELPGYRSFTMATAEGYLVSIYGSFVSRYRADGDSRGEPSFFQAS